MDKETQAKFVGDSPKLLKKMLLESKETLDKEIRKKFAKPKFDFDNKRLVSEDGTIALEWRVRLKPNSPESYKNQQTSRGITVLVSIK